MGPPPLPALPSPWRIRFATSSGPDLELVHRWMNTPHVADRWNQAWPVQQWATELSRQLADRHSRPCLVQREDEPVAYLELYRAARDPLGAHYPVDPHDLGVHIAIGELAHTGRGLGPRILRAVADGLLAIDPACRRVVAEPDVRNVASRRAFVAAGFVEVGEVTLAHKTSALLVRPRGAADLPVLDTLQAGNG